jgi:hypothetical protein
MCAFPPLEKWSVVPDCGLKFSGQAAVRQQSFTGTPPRQLILVRGSPRCLAQRRLASQVDSAKAHPDPFAAHYFAARKSYSVACRVANKGGAKIERNLISTYKMAMTLGFKGSIREWEALLRICLP